MGLVQGVKPSLFLCRAVSALHPNAASQDLPSTAQLRGPTATSGCHLVLRRQVARTPCFSGKKRLPEPHPAENRLMEDVAYTARHMGIIWV